MKHYADECQYTKVKTMLQLIFCKITFVKAGMIFHDMLFPAF